MRGPLLLLALAGIGSVAFSAESVSIISLISNPEKYDGKEVMVTGFLALDFEGSAIYLHKDDYENSIYRNGFWCSIDVVKNKRFDHKYVAIVGTFDAKRKGHLGLWSGEIRDIKRTWEPAKPKRKGG